MLKAFIFKQEFQKQLLTQYEKQWLRGKRETHEQVPVSLDHGRRIYLVMNRTGSTKEGFLNKAESSLACQSNILFFHSLPFPSFSMPTRWMSSRDLLYAQSSFFPFKWLAARLQSFYVNMILRIPLVKSCI